MKAAEEAKADASAAEQARAKMEADMAVVNASLAAAREEKQKADQEAARLEQELADLKARPVEVAVETVVDPEALEKARAEAVAEMQAKLDKAKEAKAKADEKRKQAEASVEILKKSLENMERNEKKAALSSDKDVAQFEVLFNQGQELANKMRGLLLNRQLFLRNSSGVRPHFAGVLRPSPSSRRGGGRPGARRGPGAGSGRLLGVRTCVICGN